MAKRAPKLITLALQGGGAHGAFTWGVLDRLLEDERLSIAAISGASAGAMNAVVATDGFIAGGTEGARAALAGFWRGLASATSISPFHRGPWEALMGAWKRETSPYFQFFDILSRVASPYDLNPLNWNPIRDLLESHVDFQRLREGEAMKVFVSATHVESGRARVFPREKLTVDHVMASACLPLLFQAVEIDGAPYWDGGYLGNPALWPLFGATPTDDMIIVQINPIDRPGTPRTAREILDRMNEINFNASLLSELRAIHFVHRLKDEGRLDDPRYRYMLVHVIKDDPGMIELGEASKYATDLPFLEGLFEKGRASTEAWLTAHYDDLGKRSTVDLRAVFLGE